MNWTRAIIVASLLIGHYSGMAKWWANQSGRERYVGVDFGGKMAVTLIVHKRWMYVATCFYDRMNRRTPFAIAYEFDNASGRFPLRIQLPE